MGHVLKTFGASHKISCSGHLVLNAFLAMYDVVHGPKEKIQLTNLHPNMASVKQFHYLRYTKGFSHCIVPHLRPRMLAISLSLVILKSTTKDVRFGFWYQNTKFCWWRSKFQWPTHSVVSKKSGPEELRPPSKEAP